MIFWGKILDSWLFFYLLPSTKLVFTPWTHGYLALGLKCNVFHECIRKGYCGYHSRISISLNVTFLISINTFLWFLIQSMVIKVIECRRNAYQKATDTHWFYLIFNQINLIVIITSVFLNISFSHKFVQKSICSTMVFS